MMPRPMKPMFKELLMESSCSLQSKREALAPAKAGFGVGERLVFAADPAFVADLVEVSEQERPVDLAGARFVAPRIVGELDMSDTRQVFLRSVGEFAFHALRVIDVVLDEGVVGADLVEDAHGLRG